MKFKIGEFLTEIYEVSSLYRILFEKNRIGEPSLLLVYPENEIIIGENSEEKSALIRFFSESAFVTAIVSDDDLNDEITSVFDFILGTAEVESFTEKLYSDKTKKQIEEINGCFKVSGKSAEKILEMESRAFYRLMAEKNGGVADEL